MHAISALINETPQSSSSLAPCEATTRCLQCEEERPSPVHTGMLILAFQLPDSEKEVSVVYKPARLQDFVLAS